MCVMFLFLLEVTYTVLFIEITHKIGIYLKLPENLPAVFNLGPYDNSPLEALTNKFERYMLSAYTIISIVCDATISLSLVYFLNIMQSGFRNSRNLINRLVIFSINIGLLTTAIATCTLITYLVSPTILFSGIYAINAKVYVNSMLVTYVGQLNSRVKAQEMLDGTQDAVTQ
ncbi:hypothetical protein DXG01_004324, partial [Tephrocybe rancida]